MEVVQTFSIFHPYNISSPSLMIGKNTKSQRRKDTKFFETRSHEGTKTRSFLYKSKKLVNGKYSQPFEPNKHQTDHA